MENGKHTQNGIVPLFLIIFTTTLHAVQYFTSAEPIFNICAANIYHEHSEYLTRRKAYRRERSEYLTLSAGQHVCGDTPQDTRLKRNACRLTCGNIRQQLTQ